MSEITYSLFTKLELPFQILQEDSMKYFIICCIMILTSCSATMFNLDSLGVIGAEIGYDDSSATRRLRVAVVALECHEDSTTNLTKVSNIVTQIKSDHSNIDLIVFGETIFGYYFKNSNSELYQRSLAETIPGPITLSLSTLAITNDVNIVVGIGELIGTDLYNSQVLINSTGVISIISRKHVLIEKDTKSGYLAGSSGNSFSINGIKLGGLICADSNSQTVINKLINEGTEIVIHSVAGNGEVQSILAKATNAWVLQANRIGQEDEYNYHGYIGICTPTGSTKVTLSNQEGYLFYDLGVY